MPADRDGGVCGQHRTERHQLARRPAAGRGQSAGLQCAGEPDGVAFSRAGRYLVDGLVVSEALGVVADGLVVGDGKWPAGRQQQECDLVLIGVGRHRDAGRAARSLGEQTAQLRVPTRIVGDVAQVEQAPGIVDDGSGQPVAVAGRARGRLGRGQSAVHTHERHGVVLLRETGRCLTAGARNDGPWIGVSRASPRRRRFFR